MTETNKPLTLLIERRRLTNAGSLHWAHWLVVLLSAILTLAAWYFSQSQINDKISERFQRESLRIAESVKERMSLYENALRGAAAFMDAKGGQVSYQEWRTYANSLHIDQSYLGINGIGLVLNIKTQDLESYLTQQRRFRPEFNVQPPHMQPEHWPITYIEPELPNLKAVGLDLAFESNRYNGILQARDTGEAQITGPITLVQDDKQTPGFLFYVPYYKSGSIPNSTEERRQEIIGVTYAPFIMHKLLQGTLELRHRSMYLMISDGEEILFNDSIGNDTGALSTSIKIPMHGRTWDLKIWASSAFRNESNTNQPYLILIGGIIIDTLLLALFVFLSRANRHAVTYADQVTEELQQKTNRLEKSNQDLEQFAYVASHDLKAPLRGISNISSWLQEDLEPILNGDGVLDAEAKAETKEHIKQLFSRSTRLANLLESILNYSKSGTKQYDVSEVDVNETVAEIALLLCVDDTFKLVYADLPTLHTEKIPFEIVLRNLISNAIKHHDLGTGVIHVSAADKGTHFEFRVTDDGPGIPKEYQENIFQLFATLKSRDEVEGSGMGLSTIKKILNFKDCKIWVESQMDRRGATFIFTWPKTETAR